MKRQVRIVGVPMDLGASRRGVDMGPSALRLARLSDILQKLGHSIQDSGNLHVADRTSLPRGTDHISAIADVCKALALHNANAIREGAVPLVLGGDHSLAIGSVSGVATAMAERGKSLGLIWIDAHSDINTPE